MPDISAEIKFRTARSGGKGGQNVNKVESMVEGYWDVANSGMITEAEKTRIFEKLGNRINSSGILQVKSQAERSQLGNKQLVIKKINHLVSRALIVHKKRKATRPTKESKIKRLEFKSKNALLKQSRKKIQGDD